MRLIFLLRILFIAYLLFFVSRSVMEIMPRKGTATVEIFRHEDNRCSVASFINKNIGDKVGELFGRSYKYDPKTYDNGKSLPFFMNMENEPHLDSTICERLDEKNLLAMDSSQFKTAILIVREKDASIESNFEKNENKRDGILICFVEMNGLRIHKIVRLSPSDNNIYDLGTIAKTIIANY